MQYKCGFASTSVVVCDLIWFGHNLIAAAILVFIVRSQRVWKKRRI